MKTIFKALSIFALAAMLVSPVNAGDNYSFPAGVSFKHVVGKILDPASGTAVTAKEAAGGTYTTIDFIDFGFDSSYVRICLRTDSADAYFRFATTLTTSGDVLETSLKANGMTYYDDGTSAGFIDGITSVDYGAVMMSAVASTDNNANQRAHCTTQPWQTRGLVMHIASGQATADVWGYR